MGVDTIKWDLVLSVTFSELEQKSQVSIMLETMTCPAYLLVKSFQNARRMKMDEGLANDSRHFVDIAGVCPIRIVNRGESESMFLHKRS